MPGIGHKSAFCLCAGLCTDRKSPQQTNSSPFHIGPTGFGSGDNRFCDFLVCNSFGASGEVVRTSSFTGKRDSSNFKKVARTSDRRTAHVRRSAFRFAREGHVFWGLAAMWLRLKGGNEEMPRYRGKNASSVSESVASGEPVCRPSSAGRRQTAVWFP
jgi:hypothetical protein